MAMLIYTSFGKMGTAEAYRNTPWYDEGVLKEYTVLLRGEGNCLATLTFSGILETLEATRVFSDIRAEAFI